MTRPAARPSREQVLDAVRAAVATVLELDPARLSEQTRLREDLDADSLALVEIVEIVEERLAAQVPGFAVADEEVDALTTVGDAVDLAVRRAAELVPGGA